MVLRISPIVKRIILSIIFSIGIIVAIINIHLAYKANNGFGFPLDDSWIHLQFARNLHDYGAFSYYKNEMSTAGSTSPLYTILLAIGFFITSNEFLLSYTIGISALVVTVYFMYKLVLQLCENNFIFAAAASLLLVIESRLQWIAISGMETTLFIALLLMVLFFYYSKKSIPFGIACGLLIWTRPEAIIFYIIIAFDIFYNAKIVKLQMNKKLAISKPDNEYLWIKRSAVYILILVTAYITLNLYLSGSIFPNTYAAKLKFYSLANPNFPKEVFHYLTDKHFLFPAIFAIISIILMVLQLRQRKPVKLLIPFIWAILLFIAYWKNLPRLFQNGRYLIPILPFFLLLSIDGMNAVLDFLRHKISFFSKSKVSVALLLIVMVIAAQFGNEAILDKKIRKDYFGYINDRQVKTALWVRDNLPEDAIIATHDIGAIAFYSNRRIVDMVGLVSPEMIKGLMNSDSLLAFMKRNNVTHLATLQTWFPIVNNNPIFQTYPEHPEVMEVFKFIPERFHISSQRAIRLNDIARQSLFKGNVSYAMEALQQSLNLDPLSAPTHFLIGKAERMLGNIKMAEERFQIVGLLQPDYPGLQNQLNEINKSKLK